MPAAGTAKDLHELGSSISPQHQCVLDSALEPTVQCDFVGLQLEQKLQEAEAVLGSVAERVRTALGLSEAQDTSGPGRPVMPALTTEAAAAAPQKLHFPELPPQQRHAEHQPNPQDTSAVGAAATWSPQPTNGLPTGVYNMYPEKQSFSDAGAAQRMAPKKVDRALDAQVSRLCERCPELCERNSIVAVGGSTYLINHREVELEVRQTSDGTSLIVHDGHLRQPFFDYLMGTGYHEEREQDFGSRAAPSAPPLPPAPPQQQQLDRGHSRQDSKQQMLMNSSSQWVGQPMMQQERQPPSSAISGQQQQPLLPPPPPPLLTAAGGEPTWNAWQGPASASGYGTGPNSQMTPAVRHSSSGSNAYSSSAYAVPESGASRNSPRLDQQLSSYPMAARRGESSISRQPTPEPDPRTPLPQALLHRV
eukprot:gnl/TRDRNA2_/TRDRNA2_51288_c0_seq1.p1 gnl/TRDRNA2_/TRDRNA2_51288_c0~~gnl/TRDRNA2_/TRDRNA2_51288_c0_seq1.p1  ORF type:complete len:467 (-),score=93.37 gnl/TRDRNA2_/TRDRNA2_51288_c0_seq1:21-1280(-)